MSYWCIPWFVSPVRQSILLLGLRDAVKLNKIKPNLSLKIKNDIFFVGNKKWSFDLERENQLSKNYSIKY